MYNDFKSKQLASVSPALSNELEFQVTERALVLYSMAIGRLISFLCTTIFIHDT